MFFILASACGRMPDLDGILVYATAQGIVAKNLKTGETRRVASDADVASVAVDRKGTQIAYAVKSGNHFFLMRRRISLGKSERMCGGPDSEQPWRISSMTYSPTGDAVAFVSRDVLGKDNLLLAVGSGMCLRAAENAAAADFGPGGEGLLVTDGKALAVMPMADPLNPGPPPKGGLPPLKRFENGDIRAIAVNRNYDRFAVLDGAAVRVLPFHGDKPIAVVDLTDVLAEARSAAIPEHLTFSPDGRYLAVSCGPEQAPLMLLVSATGQTLSFRKSALKWNLDPAPSAGRPAWVPELLRK